MKIVPNKNALDEKKGTFVAEIACNSRISL